MHEFRTAILSGDVKSAFDPVARKERCRRGSGEGPSLIQISIPREERLRNGLTDSLIRLSVGIEDAEDLMDDLNRAIG